MVNSSKEPADFDIFLKPYKNLKESLMTLWIIPFDMYKRHVLLLWYVEATCFG